MATNPSNGSGRKAAGGIEIYDAEEAGDLFSTGAMSIPEITDPDVSLEDAAKLENGQFARVLYRNEEQGVSLVWSWFGPGYIIPRHSHSADCLYYILRGEAHLGNRVVKAGSGFFIPADAPYAYEMGDEGVEVLEFRTEASFDMQISEKAARFAKILENGALHATEWAEMAPNA